MNLERGLGLVQSSSGRGDQFCEQSANQTDTVLRDLNDERR